MNREVHVRFWESPEVKVLRATRQKAKYCSEQMTSAIPPESGLKSDISPCPFGAKTGLMHQQMLFRQRGPNSANRWAAPSRWQRPTSVAPANNAISPGAIA